MSIEAINELFDGKTFDIRVSKNGRWIDQKCTPDVVSFVADCIVYYLENGGTEPFTSPGIWRSYYAVEWVQDIFGKPYPLDEEPHDEFNKFFRQPMKMLAAAGVLEEQGTKRNTIQFVVVNREALEYIALNPSNARLFLQLYIEKTLRDSGLWPQFESFFQTESKESYRELKAAFRDFCYANTPIKNERETGRIFPKVLNPLAQKLRKHGSEGGGLSENIITASDLNYNRPNQRDEAAKKDKNVARRAHVNLIGSRAATVEHMTRRAMDRFKQFNRDFRNSHSEVVDTLGMGALATHAHHIFPKSDFPSIAMYPENLIMLTPAQHDQEAHPNGNTQVVSPEYQYKCLCYKLKSIKENIENDQGFPVIYDFGRLIEVLNCGFGTDDFSRIDANDYKAVADEIANHYPLKVTSAFSAPPSFD